MQLMKVDTLIILLFGETVAHNLKLWRGLERKVVMMQMDYEMKYNGGDKWQQWW